MRKPAAAALAAATIALAGPAAAYAVSAQPHRPAYRHVAMPTSPCQAEDSPGPCVWDAGLRGNGHGASFWRDRRDHVHFLDYRQDRRHGWHPARRRCHYDGPRPEPRVCEYPFTYFGGWRRVSSAMSDALAEGDYGAGTSTRDWTRCIERTGVPSYIVCPDGFRVRI
ncbi:MAG TPA: hypothetical protein VFJ19_17615 [Nocardioidaceae bacterium]|nr:hypothetical protein [Nocardioidaceae bacterium]